MAARRGTRLIGLFVSIDLGYIDIFVEVWPVCLCVYAHMHIIIIVCI
jgi:hypothetical protein